MLFLGAKKKRTVLFLCIVCFAVLTGCSEAKLKETVPQGADHEQAERMDRMNAKAEHLYQAARRGEVEEAKKTIIELEQLMTGTKYDGLVSIEGVSALVDSVVTGKRVLNAVKYSDEAAIAATAKIRLAVDALNHYHQPMWQQHENRIVEQLDQIDRAIHLNSRTLLSTAFEQFQAQYDLIRPAIAISRTTVLVEQADSMIMFFGQQAGGQTPVWSELESYAVMLRQMIEDVFKGAHQDTSAHLFPVKKQPTFTWIAGIAAVIIAVLTYVGWQKYRAQADYVLVHLPREEDEFRF